MSDPELGAGISFHVRLRLCKTAFNCHLPFFPFSSTCPLFIFSPKIASAKIHPPPKEHPRGNKLSTINTPGSRPPTKKS